MRSENHRSRRSNGKSNGVGKRDRSGHRAKTGNSRKRVHLNDGTLIQEDRVASNSSRAATRIRLDDPERSSTHSGPQRGRRADRNQPSAIEPQVYFREPSETTADGKQVEYYRMPMGPTPRRIGDVEFPRPGLMITDAVGYNTKQTAAYLGVSTKTLAAWRAKGIGPKYVRIGKRRIVYVLCNLRAFVEAGGPNHLDVALPVSVA